MTSEPPERNCALANPPEAHQQVRQLLGSGCGEAAGMGPTELFRLLLDGRGDPWVSMSQAGNGYPAARVEVAFARGILKPDPSAIDGENR